MRAFSGRATLRSTELVLCLLAVVATWLGLAGVHLAVGNSSYLVSSEFASSVLFGATVMMIAGSFSLGGFRGDELLFPVVAMLSGIGIVIATRLEPDLQAIRGLDVAIGQRQIAYVLVGLLVLWGIAVFFPNPEFLANYRYTVLFAGIVLLIATAFLGKEVNGARLWIEAGGIQVQSAELVKLALVVFIAAYLSEHLELVGSPWRIGPLSLPPIPYLAPLAIMWAMCIVALLLLNDLGTALLFFALFLVLLYSANGSLIQFGVGVLAFVVGAYLAYSLIPRVSIRIDNWRDPWSDPFGAGFQQIQAEYAISSGGLLGSGIGKGSPWLIPEVQTDFVVAAIAEELGFLGIVVVVGLFLLIAGRGLRIAADARSPFLKLLAVGLTASLVIQGIVILGGVFRMLPLTGVTLPFVSYGGSSMLVSMAAAGLLLRISAMNAAGDPATDRARSTGLVQGVSP